MSAKVKIELNAAGVRDLLRSEEVCDMLTERAMVARRALGEGYATSARLGKNRWNVSVYAESEEAKREAYEDNSILKAVGG